LARSVALQAADVKGIFPAALSRLQVAVAWSVHIGSRVPPLGVLRIIMLFVAVARRDWDRRGAKN
jgi:hypothetical protein